MMGRVLRIGAGVMGVLLVVMTAGLWIAQAVPSSLQMVLANGCIGDECRTYITAPQIGWERAITSAYYATRGGVWSPDGAWYYSINNRTPEEYSMGQGEVWRISADGKTLQHLSGNWFSPTPLWTHDGQAYIYVMAGELYRTSFDNQRVENLTANFAPVLLQQPLYSADGQWVIFAATFQDLTGLSHNDAYRMRLSDQRVESLPMVDVFSDYLPLQSIDNGTWLLGNTVNSIYRVRPDGTDMQVLLTHTSRSSTDFSDLVINVWLPKNNILVAFLWGIESLSDATFGLSLDDGVTLWRLRGLLYWGYTPDEDWILFSDRDGDFYRMHPTDETPELFLNLPALTTPYGPSPDGHWAVYNITNAKNQHELYRVRIDDGKTEYLTTGLSVDEWSSDSKWMALVDFSGLEPSAIMRPDTHDIWPLLADKTKVRLLAWLQLPKTSWQPFVLLVFGIGLIGISIFGKRPYHLMSHRRRPAA